MELSSEQINLSMMHEWLLGSNAAMASESINLAWGEDTVGKSTEMFNEGEENLADQRRLGRSKLVDRQAVLEASEKNPLPRLGCWLMSLNFMLAGSSLSKKWQEVVEVEGEYFDY
ncbi:hypothetical protein KIN20_034536 [Parelaphostrongylus tenuis]|uniref:Uncharacterized protein n=1 Tax=Parelaphostrongylus tenuis TaxID=148309 RepID=A0AAD5RAD5_PARTN|nr:hypothetical protein KIN20_034536 [Parelaphostrongylus tenuis]